jgi:hypothetical protein
MSTLKLKASSELKSAPGNFNASLDKENNILNVPAEIMTAGALTRASTTEDLISVAQSFPSSMAQTLGWTPDEVTGAMRSLGTYLVDEAVLDSVFLEERDPPQFNFGALPPPGRKPGPF